MPAGVIAQAILAGLFTVACSSQPPPAPSQPSPNSTPTPLVVQQIRVSTFDTAFRPLLGARVEIVSGSGSGTAQTIGSTGNAIFTGSFSGVVAFQATKDGYLPVTRALDLRTASSIRLNMESVVAPVVTLVDSGNYTLTFTADPTCTRLPADLRTRTYAVTPTRQDSGDFAGAYVIEVPGMLFLQNRFLVGVSESYLATDDGGYPTLYESVAPNQYLGIDFVTGTTDVRIGNGGFEITLPGTFEYCSVSPGTPATFCDFFPPARVVAHERCNAPNHLMSLTRR